MAKCHFGASALYRYSAGGPNAGGSQYYDLSGAKIGDVVISDIPVGNVPPCTYGGVACASFTCDQTICSYFAQQPQ